ncbi:phosphatidylinositol glycan anchor biosynthesis class U protein-like [Oppia nitens]|uniref:phosphatidylinositol glycan anchor biosynthesis class U protein-like n=1 Tax=Oppia nitens TaxID=1686743 RepID=UPI0023DB5B77|nr:phosphatidylinositol glycan anchor biosynthesis class U protein-like [Oppia nitens]
MKWFLKISLFVTIGVFLRLSLMMSSYQKEIANRVEISSPVTSWRRAVEGVTLDLMSLSPYSGHTFHESPIFLHLYKYLITNVNQFIDKVFVLVDIITALILSLVCYKQLSYSVILEEQRMTKTVKKEDVKRLAIDKNQITDLSIRVAVIYLLSPYSLLSCVGQSTSVFTNFLMASTLLTTTLQMRLISIALLALLSLQSFYPIMMIVAIAMIIEHNRCLNNKSKDNNPQEVNYCSSNVKRSIISSILLFFIFFGAFILLSYRLMENNFQFIESTFGFLWTVPDLTPTIGIFWYFFTEMFDHFRDFFLWTFQINAFIYVIPLAITLRKNPYFLSFILLILLSLFKPYPTVSDFAIYTALLPQWTHLFSHMKQGLIITCMFISCSVLAPILWHLWIIMGTANSNFYFGVTLAYNTAQIFLITDLLFAFVKREYYIKNGVKTETDGKLSRLELVF